MKVFPLSQVLTELAEVQEGPVEPNRTGRRQCTDTDSAMSVQPPQSITTGRQVSQLHLSTQVKHCQASAEQTGQ